MKKILTLFSVLTLGFCNGGLAQNPCSRTGKPEQILTLSEGKYDEAMANDSIVQIGTALFNRFSNEIVGFAASDSVAVAAAEDRVRRFLSLDPIARKYPELTPYQFASNTPIQAIDLDGLEKWPLNSSPTPIYGPFANQNEAENASLIRNLVPLIQDVGVNKSTVKITQTGFKNNGNQTPITILQITSGKTIYTFVGMNAGIDIDVDGKGKTHGASHKDWNTSLHDENGNSLNADILSYTTYPEALDNEKYGVKLGNLDIVNGPKKGTDLEITIPTVVGDASGKHGGEMSFYGAKAFGYGKNGNDGTRTPNYTYWYAIGTSAETTESGLKNSPQTSLYMGLLYRAQQSLRENASWIEKKAKSMFPDFVPAPPVKVHEIK